MPSCLLPEKNASRLKSHEIDLNSFHNHFASHLCLLFFSLSRALKRPNYFVIDGLLNWIDIVCGLSSSSPLTSSWELFLLFDLDRASFNEEGGRTHQPWWPINLNQFRSSPEKMKLMKPSEEVRTTRRQGWRGDVRGALDLWHFFECRRRVSRFCLFYDREDQARKLLSHCSLAIRSSFSVDPNRESLLSATIF